MSNIFPDSIFREMISKLRAAGLPEVQAQIFAEECCGYRDLNRAYFKLSEELQLPSDDCFRTLAEAQKIHTALPERVKKNSSRLDSVERYLNVSYSDVLSAKDAMCAVFGRSKREVEEMYSQDPEWLLVSADSVKDFSTFFSIKFADPELGWIVFQNAAFLGPEKSEQRINAVLELLGSEYGEAAIREDARGYGWLYYRWYTDPVGCIAYMLQCRLTPEKIPNILSQEPVLLYAYKEIRTWSYNHDQEYLDKTIQKYMN